ncbi:MAG: UDP-N-acetylmuramoyl-L-alanyl-D-glutamate--2,6-diaminopimelate ligase [Spirochaetes bacterium]|nr:UDP-N-acetylmuramoyl-L-alanyl-D-glutamate--2,6-diaminopimelate ligase [Spirochaetota bacterium]
MDIRTYNSFDLYTLLNDTDVTIIKGDEDIRISAIEYDSRKVEKESLFVAIEGMETDGHKFIKDAVENKASCIVLHENRLDEFSFLLEQKELAVATAKDTRRALSQISAKFYGEPSLKAVVIGVTGTNGKTTTTYMLESILSSAGFTCGVIGTINYRWKDKIINASHTTPESKDLQDIMATMVLDGVDCIIMEVSSHALSLLRVDDIHFDCCIFTNLTRDHLDYHITLHDYFMAKVRLFDILNKSLKQKKAAFINADDNYGKQILQWRQRYGYPLFSFGVSSNADYHCSESSIQISIKGTQFSTDMPFAKQFTMRLAGRFNVYNALGAIGVADFLNVPLGKIVTGLSVLSNVPGRFDTLLSPEGFAVVVDYAHTNDALEKLLLSVRSLKPERIITVFGCGGNRDKTKRPLMGKVSEDYSDWVIVTSDNPRKENPEAIIRDITAGMKSNRYQIIVNREEAIKQAIYMASKDDIVVIAGKGHEDYQIIGTKKYHFDDKEIARKYIHERLAQ